MGTVTHRASAQGLGSYTVEIADGESAVVHFRRYFDWGRGGVGWIVAPGSGGMISVEYSLRPEGDLWVATDESPFSDVQRDSEEGQFERMRFVAIGADGVVDILCDADIEISIE